MMKSITQGTVLCVDEKCKHIIYYGVKNAFDTGETIAEKRSNIIDFLQAAQGVIRGLDALAPF